MESPTEDLPRRKVLIVEDNEGIRGALATILDRRGFDVAEYEDGTDIFNRTLREGADIVICDIVLARSTGIEVIRELRRKGSRVFIIAISGKGEDLLEEARNAGADATLAKPFRVEEVLEVLEAI